MSGGMRRPEGWSKHQAELWYSGATFTWSKERPKKWNGETQKRNGLSPVEFAALDRSAILEAVASDGRALRFLPAYQTDREVVRRACEENGNALAFAPLFQADLEVVVAAVKSRGRSLAYASSNLCNDRKVVLEALMNEGTSLEFAGTSLRLDRDIVRAACQQNPMALELVPDLQRDKELIRSIIVPEDNCRVWAGLAVLQMRRENFFDYVVCMVPHLLPVHVRFLAPLFREYL
jgi:hypothetical protein